MSRFHLSPNDPSSTGRAHSRTSSFSSNDADDLPYPLALPRGDFLSPTFSPSDYLSTLSTRHQTLEDLRGDLRERSQLLSKELLDLVNTNYEQFLSLGHELKGGEERIEDVRVGLLGFRRGVGEVREKVKARGVAVEELCGQSERVRREIELGRRLVDFDTRLEEIEGRLMVGSLGKPINSNGTRDADSADWSDDSSDSDTDSTSSTPETWTSGGSSLRKLQALVADWRRIEALQRRIGKEHPFIAAQQSRMIKSRNTIMLDLGSALKSAARDRAGEDGGARVLRILECYGSMGEGKEAVRILKDCKT